MAEVEAHERDASDEYDGEAEGLALRESDAEEDGDSDEMWE